MFDATEVEVKKPGNYQQPGVEKEVRITEVVTVTVPNGSPCIQLKTINSKGQASQTKKMYLNTKVNEGKQTSAWNVSAKFLKGILMSMGYTVDEQNKILKADSIDNLVKQLTNAMVNNKPFEGLFSAKEYIKKDGSTGRIVELYTTAPYGSNLLVWDEKNPKYYERYGAKESDLPF